MSMPLPYEKEPKKKADRLSKKEYYLKIAKTVSLRSTCLTIQFGAVIVNKDQIVGTGYNGAARGVPNCCDMGYCNKNKMNGDKRVLGHYTNCLSVHAEENAIIQAGRLNCFGGSVFINSNKKLNPEKTRMHGGSEFPEFFPCARCLRLIINAGIVWVVVPNGQREFHGKELPYHMWNIPQHVSSGGFGGL